MLLCNYNNIFGIYIKFSIKKELPYTLFCYDQYLRIYGCTTGCGLRCSCRKAGIDRFTVCGGCLGSCTNGGRIEGIDDDDDENIDFK